MKNLLLYAAMVISAVALCLPLWRFQDNLAKGMDTHAALVNIFFTVAK